MPERSTNVCVICETPLTHVFSRDAIACQSAVCQWTLSVMPANRRCVTCTRPLSDVQVASGLCGRPACHDAWATTGAMGQARKALGEIMERAAARRVESAAEQGVAPDEVDSYHVAVIPRNRHGSTQLPEQRRSLFEAHLRRTIAEARVRWAAETASGTADAQTPPESPVAQATDTVSPERRAAQNALLGQGCATCRGACCTKGGNHAFVRPDSMLRYLHRHPTRNDDAIVADYLSHVGDRTMEGGCLFQQETGCSLPREMRGTVCNSYHCTGLAALINHFGDGGPVRAYFVHKEGTTLSGGTFVQIAVSAKADGAAGPAPAATGPESFGAAGASGTD